MKIDHLRYFVVTAESQSISEAARKLHLTQPSLSSSLATLEEELGTPLFQRNHRGIHITDHGEKALNYAKSILAIYENMVNEFKNTSLNIRDIHVSMLNGLTYSMWSKDIIKYCDMNNINICVHTSTFSPPFTEDYTRNFLFHIRIYNEKMLNIIKSQCKKYHLKLDIISCQDGNIFLNRKNRLCRKKILCMNDLKNMNISIAFLTRNDEFHPFKHFIDLISNDRKIFVANRNAMLECVLNDVNTFCILNDYYEVDNHIVESLVRKKIEDISLKYYLCMFSSLDGEIREEDKNILNFIKNNCVCVT